jgi:uncharacterized integral membrane protein (TIGR00697 family)
MAIFVTVILCSNLIGVHKVTYLKIPFYGEFVFGAGILFFPISYLFGDILTEVYGYARSRRVIWAGFGAMIFASLMSYIVTNLPSATTMDAAQQAAIEMIFGQTPRIVIASMAAFWLGEFSNSFVLAKMKILTAGKWLWTRTIGSTLAGEAVDSLVFYPLAFAGIWSPGQIVNVIIGNYILKVLWEVVATPFTYRIVSFLKRVENIDYFDRETNFNPFVLRN